MRIIVAPDSYKGSVSAPDVAEALLEFETLTGEDKDIESLVRELLDEKIIG